MNVLTKKIEVSNWAPTWSLEELQVEQENYSDLCTVINWIMSHSVPTEFPKQSSHTVHTNTLESKEQSCFGSGSPLQTVGRYS